MQKLRRYEVAIRTDTELKVDDERNLLTYFID